MTSEAPMSGTFMAAAEFTCECLPRLLAYFTPNNSTSNISVAFGGIAPPAPRAP